MLVFRSAVFQALHTNFHTLDLPLPQLGRGEGCRSQSRPPEFKMLKSEKENCEKASKVKFA